MIKIVNFRGDLTDSSANKEALYCMHVIILSMSSVNKTVNDVCTVTLDLVSTRCRFIMIPR